MVFLKSLIQAVGIVFSCLILIVVTVAAFYLSYIIGIGLLIVSSIIILTYVLRQLNKN